jgi:hypothetical protein
MASLGAKKGYKMLEEADSVVEFKEYKEAMIKQ